MMIRVFLQVAYGPYGDIPFAYLQALRQLDVPVRALPIGPAAALSNERRWYDISSAFTVPMSIPFVNIVCSPANLPMGTRTPIGVLATQDDLPADMPNELRQQLARATKKASSSPIVYEPKTCFGGLWTRGVKNVAILYGKPLELRDEEEYEALSRYDLVIRHYPEGFQVGMDGKPRSLYVPPDAHELARVLGELCRSESGGTDTTAPFQVMPAHPATTSQHSIGSMTSSSRSPASRKAAIPPRSATTTSTNTPSPGEKSLAKRMWRSFTRSLGFSKP